MSIVNSILRNQFFMMSLIAGSVAVSGCVDSAQPASIESAEITANHIAITDGDALSRLAVQTVRYQHTAQGDKFSAPGFTQTAPGEWTMSANGTMMSIKLSPVAENAVQSLVSCNLSYYIGFSSSVYDFFGEAAIGQLDCTDGSASTTITTRACTNYGCSAPQSVTGTASPGAPFWSGVAMPGSRGAACSGTVSWDPQGVSVSGSNTCG